MTRPSIKAFILLAVLSLSTSPAIVSSVEAATTTTSTQSFYITFQTNAQSYTGNQTVTITGSESPTPTTASTAVSVTVFAPGGQVVEVGTAPVSTSGSFSWSFVAGGTGSWTSGSYTVFLSYEGAEVYSTFEWSPTASTSTSSSSTSTQTTSTASSSTLATTSASSSSASSSSATSHSTSSTVPEFTQAGIFFVMLASTLALIGLSRRQSQDRVHC